MDFKLKSDADEYDEQQVIFIDAIIDDVKPKLEEAGIKGDQLEELAGNVGFAIATLIDNSASIAF